MAVLLSAKDIFKTKKETVKNEVEKLQKMGVTPGFAIILTVGEKEDAALNKTQQMFANLKSKDCKEVGIEPEVVRLYEKYDENNLQNGLFECLDEMNSRDDITGTIIQFPPSRFIKNKDAALERLSPKKDVDGLSPYNSGIWMRDKYNIYAKGTPVPCTAAGIIELIDEWYDITKDPRLLIAEKEVTIVGRSYLVGKPTWKFFLERDATPIVCHRQTLNIKEKLERAEIIVSAAGRLPEIYGNDDSFRLACEMVKKDAVIISVGLQKDPATGKVYYDLPNDDEPEYQRILEKASYISPNMGGIGLKTRGRILENNLITANLCSNNIIQKGYVKT